MRINHEQTKNKILSICEMLRTQARNANEYKTAADNILADETMAQQYKNQKIAELRENYLLQHKENKENIISILEEIGNLELNNEKILELDVPEFSNTLLAINSANGHLPSDVIQGIKNNFAGQYQALNVIKTVFERYDIDLSKYGYEEYTTSVAFLIVPLIDSAENIEQSEVSTFISLQEVFKKIIHFGEVRGIKFSDTEKIFGIENKTADLLARQAMGLI